MAVERINFLKVPLDIIAPEDIEESILKILNSDGPQHIMFVSIWDVLRARRKSEFRSMVLSAALVIPTSKSILKGASFLKKAQPIRYYPFNFIISTLGCLEKHYKTLYLLGAQSESLQYAEKNLKATFPHLFIVGRYPGYFHKSMEKRILTVISKSTPSLVLVGSGVPANQKWIHKNRNTLPSSIFIWDKYVIDIFSKKRKRVSESLFEKGLEHIPEIVKNPFKTLRIFKFLWYYILLFIYRIFNLN